MFCTKCGTPNLDGALSCVSCGQPLKKKADAKPRPQLATPPAPSSKAPVPPPPEFPAPAPKLSYEPVPKPPAELLHEKKETPLVPGEVPPEIKSFNIAPLFLSFIWAFAHRLWMWGTLILLLKFIPILNVVALGVGIYLCVSGNELAWKAGNYTSVKQFKDAQRIWAIVSVCFFCVAFTGILVAVAIPNFLRAKDKASYNRCVQVLSAVKVAEEMYVSDNKEYTNDMDRLAMYALPGCSDPDGAGCYGKFMERIDRNCKAESFSFELSDDGSYYWIKAISQDKNSCHICMTQNGYAPERYIGCKQQMDFQCP